jgi:hypothetical protein
MSSFTKELKVTPYKGSKWILTEPFAYYTYLPTGKKDFIIVPKGFITDFASSPRILWSIFPPFGRYTKASVLHDFLYSIRFRNNRKLCDDIFLEAMQVLKVDIVTRTLFYVSVRLFGAKHW